MEIKHIKELMTAMGRTGTKRLSIKKEGLELELEQQESGVYKIVDPVSSLEDEQFVRHDAAFHRAATGLSKSKEMPAAPNASLLSSPASTTVDDAASVYVTSPMVGTFYSSPSPDEPVFVKAGDKIEANTIVCIIEAMKVMNEVKAGVSGTVAESLVESGHPVEFGTKLFRII